MMGVSFWREAGERKQLEQELDRAIWTVQLENEHLAVEWKRDTWLL
jgi:hypothetical protein